MERLMVLKLQAQGCHAQAWLNGVLVARVGPACPSYCAAVHEYALAGANHIELRVGPTTPDGLDVPRPPQVAAADMVAGVSVLLPRVGAPADPGSARNLAECSWSVAAGEVYEWPAVSRVEVSLPVNFPRWRWLEAPVIVLDSVARDKVLRLLQQIALDLARGQTESLLTATRLRTEELALAYQRPPDAEHERLRESLERLYALQHPKWMPVTVEALRLRPLAGGRLLECLDASGEPALRTEPLDDGSTISLPLRVAIVEGHVYVLR